MKKLIILISVIAFWGCDKDSTGTGGGESYTIADLVGTWEMLTEETITTIANQTPTTENRVADNNNSKTLTVYENGTFYIDYLTDGAPDDDSGSFTINGNSVTVDIVGNPIEITGTLSITANILTMVTYYNVGTDDIEDCDSCILVHITTILQKISS